jgi:hypothetical protein
MTTYRVTFSDRKFKPLDYSNASDAIRWGLAPRWGARNVWRIIDGKREALVLDRYPTQLGRAYNITE